MSGVPRNLEATLSARIACNGLLNSGLNLPAFFALVFSLPPTVARRVRANFTVGGCLACRCVFVVLTGPQVKPKPLCRAVFFGGGALICFRVIASGCRQLATLFRGLFAAGALR